MWGVKFTCCSTSLCNGLIANNKKNPFRYALSENRNKEAALKLSQTTYFFVRKYFKNKVGFSRRLNSPDFGRCKVYIGKLKNDPL